MLGSIPAEILCWMHAVKEETHLENVWWPSEIYFLRKFLKISDDGGNPWETEVNYLKLFQRLAGNLPTCHRGFLTSRDIPARKSTKKKLQTFGGTASIIDISWDHWYISERIFESKSLVKSSMESHLNPWINFCENCSAEEMLWSIEKTSSNFTRQLLGWNSGGALNYKTYRYILKKIPSFFGNFFRNFCNNIFDFFFKNFLKIP